MYIGLDEECYVLQGVNNNTVMKQSVPGLDSQHEEADTIVWHLSHIHINRSGNSTNVQVQCNDTDVHIILLYHIHRYVCKVSMDVGPSSQNIFLLKSTTSH